MKPFSNFTCQRKNEVGDKVFGFIHLNSNAIIDNETLDFNRHYLKDSER